MEEQKNGMPESNVTPQETNVPAENSPIQEKLSEIEEKQDMTIPEPVKEVAEPAIEAAAQAVGDVPPKTEKVKVKKPTKTDPLIIYGDNVVLWYIEC